MRKFIIATFLVIFAMPIASFAQTSVSAACPISIPSNPTSAADWTTTITCLVNHIGILENRVGVLENRVSVLEARISGGPILPGMPATSTGPTLPGVPASATPTTGKCDATTNICVIQQGASNDGVKAVQTFLRSEGAFNVAPTGYFGPITKSAVQQFQAAQGLTQTGVVDQATLNKIQTLAPQVAPSLAPTLQQVKATQ